MTDIISPTPLSLYFVGLAPAPLTWQISDRCPDRQNGTVTLMSMSIVERAAFRALLNEGLRMLDATDALESA